MCVRVRRLARLLLQAGGLGLLLLLAAVSILVGFNRRDAPPPEVSDLAPAPRQELPANSNGWYFIREAVRDAWIPCMTARLFAVWHGSVQDMAGIRALLASNTLALAWTDRAVDSNCIAPPQEHISEDNNWLGWSPIGTCGRLLRLRAQDALNAGRTNDALRDYRRSLRLACLYLDCPPAREVDALAAFVEVRNALHAVRDASGPLGVRAVWREFGGELRRLSDLRESRRRASAAALENDRRELDCLHRIADGVEEPAWDSPFDSILPGRATLAGANRMEQLICGMLRLLPTSYWLHPNRTLAIMAGVRRGGPMPPEVAQVMAARASSSWLDTLAPARRLLGPNGLGETYVIIQAERQSFIEGGTRLAECAARGTRLSLALWMYEREHGALPQRLEALAPAWIEAVPGDPYCGQSFRYDRTRRLVYSVGPNRRDDGGRLDDVLFPVP